MRKTVAAMMMGRRAARPQVHARERRLKDLESVGPATLRDLSMLGIESVEQLARCEPTRLYDDLCAAVGVRVDPCCEDVFAAAIAQARDPDLPPEQRQWWFWTRARKERALRDARGGARDSRARGGARRGR